MYGLTRLSLRSPAVTALALLVVTGLLGSGLLRLREEFGYRVLLGGDHPAIQTLERFIETYGGGFPLLVVWECGDGQPCRTALDAPSLSMASALEQDLQWVEGVRRVQSAASTTLVVPAPDGFALRRLVEDGVPVADLDALAKQALQDPLWVRNLVSEDGSVGSIVVFLQDAKNETMVHVVEAVQAALYSYEQKGFQFRLVGHAFEAVVAGGELARSTAALTPVVVLIIGLMLYLMTRSCQGVVVVLATMGTALLWTFGLLGWLGWPQDSIQQVLAPMLLVIGVCEAVHLFSRTSIEMRAQGAVDTPEVRTCAVLAAVQDVGAPCVITTFTTAFGLLSFVTSNLQTFIRFGIIAAFGVIACLVLTFTLLPMLIRVLPATSARVEHRGETWSTVLGAISDTAERRATPILITAVLLLIVGMVGWTTCLRVDTEIGEMYGENSRVTRWIRFVDERLRGLDSLEIEVALPENAPIESPETQARLGRFITFLDAQEGLGRVTSIQDLISTLNRRIHGNDPAFERTGTSTAENGEILGLAEMDAGDSLGFWLSFDRSRTRISAEGPTDSTAGRGTVLGNVRRYVVDELPNDWEVTLTGPFALEYNWVTEIATTQLRSFASAFATVLILIALFLRSATMGLLAMIPALLPVVVTLGFMGFSGTSLDVGRVMIAAVVIGIATDDSVHLLRQFRLRLSHGQSHRAAMRASILHSGRAIVINSLVLSLGFLTLLASAWQSISSFGFFVSVAILGGLAATLFVVPAVVFVRYRRHEPGLVTIGAHRQKASAIQKQTLIGVALLAVVAGLTMATLPAIRAETQRALPCWVLPSGRVLSVPLLTDACPLDGDDWVERAELPGGRTVEIEDLRAEPAFLFGESLRLVALRNGSPIALDVPLGTAITPVAIATRAAMAALASAILLAIPVLLIWRTSSPAASPLTLFYAAASILVTYLLCGQTSPGLQRLAVVALVAAPATLAHLALTFPSERAVLRRRPGLLLTPYLAAGLLLPPAWVAIDRFPVLWPPVLGLVLILCGGAWTMLLVSCWFAIRESTSAVERARAKLLLYANLLLPTIPAAWVARAAPTHAALVYLGAASLALPLPIALAISRYNLFDLEADARRAIYRVLYVTLAAAIVTTGFFALGLADPVQGGFRLFTLALACIALAEALRRPLLGYFAARLARRQVELSNLRQRFLAEMAELREPDEIAQLLGHTLLRALHARALCVFVAEGSVWRSACSLGDSPPLEPELAVQGWELTRREPIVHRVETLELEQQDALSGASVELVARLTRADKPLGLVLLTSSTGSTPFTRLELEFVAAATSAAALALHNSRLAEELMVAELHANTARVAVALIHQIGKELDWIGRLAQRLPERFTTPEIAAEDAEMIRALSEDANRLAHGFLEGANDSSRIPGVRTLDGLIDRAVRIVGRRHGEGRVSRVVDPSVQWSAVEESLESVLVNLLDNALQASPSDVPVHVFATRDGSSLRIEMRDRGCGMTPEVLASCGNRGFTTRAEGEGHGVGLAVSCETLIALGGTLELKSTPGKGTVATVRVPVSDDNSRSPSPLRSGS